MTSMSHNAFKIRPQAVVWQCDRMPSQTQWLSGALHSYHGAAGYGPNYRFASIHHGPLSGDARQVEKSPSPPALLARGDASPLPGAENRRRTGPLDAGLEHRLALAPRT